MNVPLLDLKAQLASIGQELKQAVIEVIDSTRYIGGPKVEELERQIAALCGAAEGIGMSSGTDALLAAVMAVGVGPGDLVITTPYSFFATAGVVARVGATPVFVDIDSATYNIDPAAVRAWFDDHPADAGRVKAIVPVHLYGQCADMDPILEIARERGIAVIEDAAQAVGATYPSANGVLRAGGMGQIGCLSFFPSKNLGGIGEGGMALTSCPETAETLRKLRNHGAQERYYHALIGGNFRLDPVQAAVLLVKLPRLMAWTEGRRANAARYDEAFDGTGIQSPRPVYGREHHVYNQYVVCVPGRREALRAELVKEGIGHEVYYPVPFHMQECFRNLGYQKGAFPHSEDAAKRTLALPVYAELPRDQQDFVIGTILRFYGM
jgi:dTDP-4-amino-4,6-dideoxygalactose transaminase